MGGNTALLVLTIVTALAFDFTNGFHDTANAMATSVTTGALRPKIAVLLAAVLNFLGALLSLSVAATIANGIVDAGAITLTVVFAGLVGGICWNLATWYLGLPSSSSHALIGGVVGATIIADGMSAVKVDGLISKVIIPAVLAPFAAGLGATVGTFAVYRITRGIAGRTRDGGFRVGQVGSASLGALAHGTNDAQKTMGIITLALIANGSITAGRMVTAWVFTLPAAGGVGGLAFWIANSIGGAAGVTVVAVVAVAFATVVFGLASRAPITADNVNDDWAGGLQPAEHAVAAGAHA